MKHNSDNDTCSYTATNSRQHTKNVPSEIVWTKKCSHPFHDLRQHKKTTTSIESLIQVNIYQFGLNYHYILNGCDYGHHLIYKSSLSLFFNQAVSHRLILSRFLAQTHGITYSTDLTTERDLLLVFACTLWRNTRRQQRSRQIQFQFLLKCI